MNRIFLRTAWVSGLLLSIYASTTLGQTLEVLYSFQGPDGAHPQAQLVQGTNGAWYGSTFMGGANLTDPFGRGWGTLFRLTPDGTLTTLFSFDGSNGGLLEYCPLVPDGDGSFYGVSRRGGDMSLNGGAGEGTAFKITDDGTFTNLVAFSSTSGGAPARMLLGKDGNFYGVSTGYAPFQPGTDYGTVFEMTPTGALTTLVRFNNVGGLANPISLLQGADGNFYGTTTGQAGAATDLDGGIVFKVTPAGVLKKLVSFPRVGSAQSVIGLNPLIQGIDGNLYGTTEYGGNLSTNALQGEGTVFRLALDGTLTTLIKFDGTNGAYPNVGLAISKDGLFYGLTGSGGDNGLGTVFRMSAEGPLTTLYSFTVSDPPMGGSQAELAIGDDGNLYGTTYWGGDYNNGTVFRISLPLSPPTIQLSQVANRLVLSWPTNAIGFTLQSSSNPTLSANWVDSTDIPSEANGHYFVTNTMSGVVQFYRLRQ